MRKRQRLACPQCAEGVRRARRSAAQRWLFLGTSPVARYGCTNARCAWTGLIDRHATKPQPAMQLWLVHALRGPVPLALATLAIVAASWNADTASAARITVGTRSFAQGEVFDGEDLPASHPLQSVSLKAQPANAQVPVGITPKAPAPARPPKGPTDNAAAHAAAAGLGLRRFCAWGSPGRMPYRGTVDEALRAVQIPAAVREQIVAAVAAGQVTERLTIGNDGIRALASGQVFDHRRFAMTYGRMLCLGTHVNFKPGHTEPASLFQAKDPANGRLYSVMVPDVCGNVSVLSQRGDKKALREPWDAEDAWGRLTAMDGKPQQVPEPDTLALSLLGLVAASAVRLRWRGRGAAGPPHNSR
jgi:hypothetical protein